MSDSSECLDVIEMGTVFDSPKSKYVVDNLIGDGTYGQIYQVHLHTDKFKIYSMKLESEEHRMQSKLKREMVILKLVSSERKQSHFTNFVDIGKSNNCFFMITQLVGKTLSEMKAACPEKVLSTPCGLAVAKQGLEACQDLHKHGFIHQNLQPANFAIGTGGETRLIYILDFSMARKIVNEKGELKAPRPRVLFRGTVRFASLACHNNQELSPKDDCESLFYVLLDLIVPQDYKNRLGFPWKKIINKNDAGQMKQDCRREKKELMLMNCKCKTELAKLLEYFDGLKYEDTVDYGYAYKLLGEAATSSGGSLTDPYDWE